MSLSLRSSFQDLAKLIIKARREEHNEKKMYQKMLGQANKLEQKNKQPQKQQTVESSKVQLTYNNMNPYTK